MRRIVFFSLILILSCKKETVPLNTQQQSKIVDSLVTIKKKEILRLAAEDLDFRRSIEVKEKTDSIVIARTTKSGDTTQLRLSIQKDSSLQK
ncbi:MAG: hypothetical protein JST52_00770 [Bacteroidetes bacterium]|nr:hypothetical protein [Bacteroidota bacterium]MBS1740333.1 hypothetical protein [Bacteroidota bacterium]